MKTERWSEIKKLFQETFELPPGEIADFLDRSCGEDFELRREVEALIRADDRAGRFLARPIFGERAPAPGATPEPARGNELFSELLRQFEKAEGARDGPAERFAPGAVLGGRYRIVHLVGRGGMGEIYRADDLTLEQPVALKFLREPVRGDTTRRSRLLEEVKIARRIAHPNVCRVYDVGEVDSQLFLSMELIEGEDLASLLRRIGGLTQNKALEMTRQITEGLAAAHTEGVLHCDLKPANLMIDGDGQVRITDFGIARAAGDASETGGHGTPAYMAPEQFTLREATIKTDIYALGLVMYELFTGRHPFEAETAAEVGRPSRETSISPPSRWGKDLDPAVETLILSCLEKDPRDRPSSVSEVIAALPESGVTGAKSGTVKTLLVSHLACRERQALREDQARYLESLHQRVLKRSLKEHQGREIERNASTTLLLFDRAIQAVGHALAYHRALENLSDGEGMKLAARVGIHLCEVVSQEDSAPAPEKPRPKAMDLDITGRLSSLAGERQTLMTRGAFDRARQSAADGFQGVRWMAHGSYEMAGLVESLEVYEVGEEGLSPLRPPGDSGRGRRRLVQNTISGWRPAPGQELPPRPHWTIEKRLSEGGFGELWLAAHRKTRERRVFKFCYDPARLRSLQREITLFRLLKETLGDREDITRVLDWNFHQPPYFIESEYTAGGSLIEWAESAGGLKKIALATRLDIVAQVATALAAAHSVGVLHKDVKPGNVLIVTGADRRVRARLSDFGVGRITERQRLVEVGITELGMTDPETQERHPWGTRLYMAPEVLEGKPATLQADIYSLGVVLYQMVMGDFSRALAPGWDRDVADELLREDIAMAVDGSPERRLSSAAKLGERLRSLKDRRERRAAKRREEIKARKLEASLATARRRRKMMALAIGVLALISTVITALLYDVKQQAQRANREAKTARQVSKFLVDLFETSTPYRYQRLASKITAREILDRGAERIERELRGEPLVKARMMQTIGVIYLELGAYGKAAELIGKALEIRREIHGAPDLEVVESLSSLATIMLEKADFKRAEELSREALDIRRRLPSEEGAPDVTDGLELLARSLYSQDDLENAEASYHEAWKLHRERSGGRSFTASKSLHGMAVVHFRKGDREKAERVYRDLLREQTHALGPDHRDVAVTMNSLAFLLASEERWEEAQELYEKTIAIRRQVLGDHHPDTALAINNLAELFLERGHYREAERYMRESRSAFEQSLGGDHPYVAFVEYGLARLFKKTGDRRLAREHLRNSLASYKEALGEDHPDFVYIRNDLRSLLDEEAP